MRRALLLLLLSLPACLHGQTVRYEREDSLCVVRLLDEAARQSATANLVLFFAHQFEGAPYEAATLEGSGEEQLVVNLRAFDCTTFVETVLALALTARNGSPGWDDFLRHLTLLRYHRGRIQGYASRNHYFTQWALNADSLGLLSEPQAPVCSAARVQQLHYMSRHPEAYPALQSAPGQLQQIRQREQEASGRTVRYIPSDSLSLPTVRREIADGDVLALVTRTAGLDVSHMGLAEWGSDGRLHLLHASSRQGRVVLDAQPLARYLHSRPSLLGLRVLRLRP